MTESGFGGPAFRSRATGSACPPYPRALLFAEKRRHRVLIFVESVGALPLPSEVTPPSERTQPKEGRAKKEHGGRLRDGGGVNGQNGIVKPHIVGQEDIEFPIDHVRQEIEERGRPDFPRAHQHSGQIEGDLGRGERRWKIPQRVSDHGAGSKLLPPRSRAIHIEVQAKEVGGKEPATRVYSNPKRCPCDGMTVRDGEEMRPAHRKVRHWLVQVSQGCIPLQSEQVNDISRTERGVGGISPRESVDIPHEAGDDRGVRGRSKQENTKHESEPHRPHRAPPEKEVPSLAIRAMRGPPSDDHRQLPLGPVSAPRPQQQQREQEMCPE